MLQIDNFKSIIGACLASSYVIHKENYDALNECNFYVCADNTGFRRFSTYVHIVKILVI